MDNDLNVKPLNIKAEKLAIMLHGIGSDGRDLLSLVPYMQKKLPNVHFFSPNGIEKANMAMTGYRWFNLEDTNLLALNKELGRVYPKIMDLVKKKLDELNLQWKDLILIGFSQGAMVATYLTLSSEERLTATISFSGVCIPPVRIPNYISKTPICLIHGQEDSVVEFKYLDLSFKKLQEYGFLVEKHVIPNLEHSIDSNCINKTVEFILSNI